MNKPWIWIVRSEVTSWQRQKGHWWLVEGVLIPRERKGNLSAHPSIPIENVSLHPWDRGLLNPELIALKAYGWTNVSAPKTSSFRKRISINVNVRIVRVDFLFSHDRHGVAQMSWEWKSRRPCAISQWAISRKILWGCPEQFLYINLFAWFRWANFRENRSGVGRRSGSIVSTGQDIITTTYGSNYGSNSTSVVPWNWIFAQ